jgi:hypothetical protein
MPPQVISPASQPPLLVTIEPAKQDLLSRESASESWRQAQSQSLSEYLPSEQMNTPSLTLTVLKSHPPEQFGQKYNQEQKT